MLWVCLYFPDLSIERLGCSDDHPTAVIRQNGPRREVMACNTAARQVGIRAGLALKSAYALLPDLKTTEHDPVGQRAYLQQLALWALHYSSWVAPRQPDCILLELKSSLKLFGGLDALYRRLIEDISAQALTVQTGLAPTPAAAVLFARVGRTDPVTEVKLLPAALASIGIEQLGFDEFCQRGLRQSGIRTIGQLQSIAPASLTRRFGHECTETLYRLVGTLPDPCPAFEAPITFREALDLPLEAPDTTALAFPLHRLLNALGGFLKSGDRGVKALRLQLYHARHPPTVVMLQFLEATADHGHVFKVANERLANITLPAPVMRLAVEATEITAIEREGKDLFHKSRAQTNAIGQVMEKLMARLGRQCLYTALPGDDHRPEKAWEAAMLAAAQHTIQWPARPLWLLQTPRLANEALELCTPPERIENGWWDDTDVRRDYFIACNRSGAWFWVYRLRNAPDTTYIHGLFG